MDKWVIWFLPENKKIQFNQFHTEAATVQEAIQNLKENADFTYKIMGAGNWRGKQEEYINNKFY
jgi:hypothetical protein